MENNEREVEMKRTIFEGLRRGNYSFYNDVQKIIRFNSYFTKLGFERVNMNENFDTSTYYQEMTLMINPNLLLTDNIHIPESDKDAFTRSRTNQRDMWHDLLKTKQGFIDTRIRDIIYRANEIIKPIIFQNEDKELIFGHYLKERNIVILYINPFYSDMNSSSNEFLEFILKIFEIGVKNIKLEKIDVSEKIKKNLIEMFQKQIKDKIDETSNCIKRNITNICQYQESLLNEIKHQQINTNQIKTLAIFRTDTDTSIKNAIEELKELPFVKNISLVKEGITLDVGSITIKYRNSDVYIGDFYLIISPNSVKCYCRNPVVVDGTISHHPHIEGNHNCFGDERTIQVINHLSAFELKKLVFLIYVFLKTYTPNNFYFNISRWIGEGVIRTKTEKMNTESNTLNTSFQGDYLFEPSNNNDIDENNENEDEDDGDGYIGDCARCGDCLYESEDYIRDDNDILFCGRECKDEYYEAETNNP
jgi:hypothetical protein